MLEKGLENKEKKTEMLEEGQSIYQSLCGFETVIFIQGTVIWVLDRNCLCVKR